MPYSAYVFARPGGAIIMGFPYGHVGFGFQVDERTVRVGAVECDQGSTSHVKNAMDFWTKDTPDPLGVMASETKSPKTRYDMCKIITVSTPNVAAAVAQVSRIESVDYNLLSQNCRTDAVQILEAFGVTGLPGGARPSGFFGGIHATIVPLVAPWPTLQLDFSLYAEPDQFGLRDDPDANANGYVADPTADENPNGPDWPLMPINSILVRRGYLALFDQQSYTGNVQLVNAGRVFNRMSLEWQDKTIRSWYASTSPIADPTGLASTAPLSRFSSPTERVAHAQNLGLPPTFTPEQQKDGVLGH